MAHISQIKVAAPCFHFCNINGLQWACFHRDDSKHLFLPSRAGGYSLCQLKQCIAAAVAAANLKSLYLISGIAKPDLSSCVNKTIGSVELRPGLNHTTQVDFGMNHDARNAHWN